MSTTDYRGVADALAAEIEDGRLKPGDRLPPLRAFAHIRGIATSTAGRVYAELNRHGLTLGEVGRGTFVRSDLGGPGSPQPDAPSALVDLQRVHSCLPEQSEMLAEVLTTLARSAGAGAALNHYGPVGTPRSPRRGRTVPQPREFAPDPGTILFTGNGRQAVAATLAAIAKPGDRVGCEALTYPVVKGIAARLGIALVPLAMDGEGVHPDAIQRAHRAAPLSGLYLQPTLQNPLGLTMGPGRRAEIAAMLEAIGLVAVEDAVYGFLADAVPLAAHAPRHTILIDSLSKRVMPGLTVGMIMSPPGWTDQLAASVRQGGWSAAGVPLAAGVQWMGDGSAERLAALKRIDAAARQSIARAGLAGLPVGGEPTAYHLWLELPEAWRAEAFAAAALHHGIALTSAASFAVAQGHARNAVRLALASPPLDVLERAILTLRGIVVGGDDHFHD